MFGLEPVTIGFIGIGALLLLLLLEVPVGISMIVVGFCGMWAVAGLPQAFSIIGTIPYRTSLNYVWSLIPLFVFMGQIAYHTGLGADLFNVASNWLGRFRGGLAMTTVCSQTLFGAVCGDNIAAAITFSHICLPELKKHGYNDGFSIASVCAGSLLSFLIPPSVGFIIYGIIVNANFSQLFIAGIIPGILLTILYMLTIVLICKIKPDVGPAGEKISFSEMIRSLGQLWAVFIVVLIIFGGIFSGLITPTEAGAMGAFAVTFLGLVRGRLTWHKIVLASKETFKTVGMVFLMFIGAYIFSPFMTISTIPMSLTSFLTDLSSFQLILFLLVFYFLGGLLMDSVVLMLVSLPLFIPALNMANIDFIYLGVIMILLINLGSITPPVGVLVYVVSGLVPEYSLVKLFSWVAPFMIAVLIVVAMLLIIPDLATFLPKYISY